MNIFEILGAIAAFVFLCWGTLGVGFFGIYQGIDTEFTKKDWAIWSLYAAVLLFGWYLFITS